MKKLLKKGLLVATAASLCACSSNTSTDESASTQTTGGEPVSFAIWHTFTEDQQALLETFADEYEAAHEGVNIEVIGGYDSKGFEATVQDAVINGVGPQLVFNYASFAKNFDGYDMLIDFGANWDLDYPSLVSAGTLEEAASYDDGKIHSVPIQTTGPILFYNKAVYDELGLTEPKTWEDLKNNSKVVFEKTGKSGLAVDSLTDLATMFILQSHDGKYVDIANKKVLWNDEKTLEWVNWWAEGIQEGYFQIAPTTGDYNSADMNAGALVAYIGSSAGLPYLDLSAIDGELAVTRIPMIDETHNQVVNWNRSAIGFKKDEATDKVVADFVKYLVEQNQRWVECVTAYSPYYAVQENASYQEYVKGNIALEALGLQINDGLVVPSFPGSAQVREELKTLLAGAADPNFDAQAALENAAALSEAAMNE